MQSPTAPTTGPLPAYLPDLKYSEIYTSISLNAGDVIVTIECQKPADPTATRPDPVYNVTINQAKILKTTTDVGLYLIALGLQSASSRKLQNGKMTGTLQILHVEPSNVELGRIDRSATGSADWVIASTAQSSTDPMSYTIEPLVYSPTGEPLPMLIRSSQPVIKLTLQALNGAPKFDTRWDTNAGGTLYAAKSSSNDPNVPPPVPPGSSEGD